MKKDKLGACLLAALLLTGCGEVTSPGLPAGYSPATAEQTGTTDITGADTAAQTAFTTAATGDTSAAVTDAAASDTAPQTAPATAAPQTNPPQADPPQAAAPQTNPPQPDPPASVPQAQPKLTARCITDGYFGTQSGAGHSYFAGEEYEVQSFRSDGSYTGNYMELKLDGDPSLASFSARMSDFLLLPTKEYTDSLSDAELNQLAAALNLQYSALYVDFLYDGGTLNTDGSGVYDGYWERLDPPHSWNDLMAEYRKYFTDDCAASDTYGSSQLSDYLREQDGSLWRVTGYGGPGTTTYCWVNSVASRSDSAIEFDMGLKTRTADTEYNDTAKFGIRLENGYWKCCRIRPIWFMD